jgi:hypothetical protein
MENAEPLQYAAHYASRGLVPTHFNGQWIIGRYPYTMPAERVVAASTQGDYFPEDVFRNSTSHPFEVWRMLIRLTGVSDDTPPYIYDPQPTTLNKHVRIRVNDVSHDRFLNRAMQLVDSVLLDNSLTWEWEVPYTLDQSNGLMVQVDTTVLPEYCVPDLDEGQDCDEDVVQIAQVRVEVVFQGFMLILGPKPPPNA